MSKDKDKNNWFGGINFNPFHFKRNTYLPHYDTGADYNTNSKSYYDYLSRVNKILEMFKKFIIRLLNRDVKVEDTNTVKMKKEGDWINNGKGCPPDNYDDEIILSADVKISEGRENLVLNDTGYEVGNALTEKQDGLFSPDYKQLMEEFEASGGGTELEYSDYAELLILSSGDYYINNGSKNRGVTDIHELWSPDYEPVLRQIDREVFNIKRELFGLNELIDGLKEEIENPPEIDFGYIHDTFLPKTSFYYSLLDFNGEEMSDRDNPQAFIFTLPSTPVNLSPGNRDIVVSFTPVVINPDKYDIEEIIFWNGQTNGLQVRYLKNGTETAEEIYSSIGEGLVSGRRYHMRLSQNYSAENFRFSSTYTNHVIHAVLKNKATGATFKPWILDGDKPIPQTEEEMQQMEFYMKDVEIRVVNQ